MNQGLYHPSFNANGAAKASDDKYWHDTTQTFTSQADCFNPAKLLAGSGSIASGKSGRPSGGNLYYDAIYSSGAGGVCRDMRYSAYGVDLVDFAEADPRVKNGTYRGFEKQVFTRVALQVGVSVPVSHTADILKSSVPRTPWIGEYLHAFDANVNAYVRTRITSVQSNGGGDTWWLGLARPINRVVNTYVILEQTANMSVGGSYLQTDVVGNPANILATPVLAKGWQGRWIGTGAGTGTAKIPLARKYVGHNSSLTPVYSLNNGLSWSPTVSGVDTVNNAIDVGLNNSLISIVQYEAFALQTEPASNAEVYGGDKGIGAVSTIRVSDTKEGCLLQESLIGKVNIESTAWITSVNLITIGLSVKGKLVPLADYASTHPKQMFDSLAPGNNSPSVKCLNYNVNVNQQAFIQYAYAELKHNGTSWGDDGKIIVVDKQSTKTDLNGNTVLIGTAKLKEPIGWIHNNV